MLQPPVTSQPGRKGLRQTPVYVSPKGVTVRTMVEDDSEFAGKILVDAFKDKYTHTIGTQNLHLAKQALAEDHALSAFKHHRTFIAEFEGQKAGVMELIFPGERNGVQLSNLWDTLSCWPMYRLGCMTLKADEKVKRGHCYLDYIGVDERFRGKGVGTALMAVADQQARKEGCHILYLRVASDNRAQNLYSREGFQRTSSSTYCGLAYFISGRSRFLKMEKRLWSETPDNGLTFSSLPDKKQAFLPSVPLKVSEL